MNLSTPHVEFEHVTWDVNDRISNDSISNSYNECIQSVALPLPVNGHLSYVRHIISALKKHDNVWHSSDEETSP
jgi:hypothetical protein